MTDISHDEARRLISAKLDESLSSAEASALAAHLRGCDACLAFQQRLVAGLAGITALPRVPGNPVVAERVRQRVGAGQPAGWLGGGLKLAGAAAAFAVVGLVLALVLRPGDGPSNGLGAGSPTAESTSVVLTPTPTPVPTQPATTSSSHAVCDPNALDFVPSEGAAAGSRGITITAQPLQQPAASAGGGATPAPLQPSGTPPCHLSAPVTLTITDQSGQSLDIEGNGAQATIEGDLPDGEPQVTFLWSNWCGDAQDLLGVATIGEAQTQFQVDAPPCNGPGQPSHLSVAGVSLPTPTAPPGGLSICRSNDYTLFAKANGAMGRTVIYVNATHTGAPCHLTTDVTLTIEDADGQPLDIQGNGAVAHIDADLADGAGAAFLWSNWCGDRDGLLWDISADGQATAQSAEGVASCGDAAQPSTLELLPASDATPAPEPTPTTTGSDLPECQDDQLTIIPRPDQTGDDVTFTITASLFPVPTPATSATPCRLAVVAALTLTDADGQPLDIDGNGALTTLANDLGQYDGQIQFVWSNWCGDAGVHFGKASIGAVDSDFKFSEIPACHDAGQPSRLIAVAVPPAQTPTPTLAACGPDDYSLEMNAQGATGSAAIGVRITPTGAPCHLTADATLTILGPDGAPLAVEGNPATMHIDANLTSDGVGVGALWSNWCGDLDGIQFQANVGAQTTTIPAQLAGRCDAPDRPSSLVHVEVSDPNAPDRPLLPTATP